MRTKSALKQIARDRLRGAYWASFIVVGIAFFEYVVKYFARLFHLIIGTQPLHSLEYLGLPARRDVLSTYINFTRGGFNWIILVCVLLFPVLYLGLATYFLKLLRGQDAKIKDVFSQFKLFFRALMLSILFTLIVGIFIWGLYVAGHLVSSIFELGLGFQTIIVLLTIILAIFVSLTYSMSYFVLADNPNLTALQAMDKSKRIMEGNKGNLFMLELSFIGWILLDYVFGGLFLIFIQPYMIATVIAFYIDITNPVELSTEIAR